MNVPSINRLKETRDGLKKSIKKLNSSEYEGATYGPENEYSAKGVIAGINAITTDLSALLRTPSKFVQITTHGERSQLEKYFTSIQAHVNTKDLASIVQFMDAVKVLMRSFGVRNGNDRQDEFIDGISELQRKSLELSESILKFNDSVSEIEDTNAQLSEHHKALQERLSQLESEAEQVQALISETETKRTKIQAYLEKDTEMTEEIEALLSDAKSHKEIIEGFSKRVVTRESQLEEQQERSDAFNIELKSYSLAQADVMKEAMSLIENAKTALEYKTAEGLSAAFTEKYNESKNDGSTSGWIIAAGLFLVTAVAIGIWIVSDKGITIETIVARVSLLPMLIAGAWFGAAQYIKQKNIAEDYAYKSVLTKSMVGFSEQLSTDRSKGEEYSHYIKSVLGEIHNDPLRKHGGRDSQKTTDESKIDISKQLKELSEMYKKFEKAVEKS